MHKSRVPGKRGDKSLYRDGSYLWALYMLLLAPGILRLFKKICTPLVIIMAISSVRKWTGHVARME